MLQDPAMDELTSTGSLHKDVTTKEGDMSRLSQAKVVLLGDVGAGKTSLMNAIRFGCPRLTTDTAEGRTVGITVNGVLLSPDVKIWLYDFGGHDTYNFCHHLFLSDNSLYILTIDISTYESERFNKAIGFWYRLLTARLLSPIICLVVTHIDEIDADLVHERCTDIKSQLNDLEATQVKLFHQRAEEIECSIKTSPVRNQHFATSNLFSKFHSSSLQQPYHRVQTLIKNRPRLETQIYKLSSKTLSGISEFCRDMAGLIQMNQSLFPVQNIPRTWLELEHSITTGKEALPYITWREFVSLARQHSVLEKETEQLLQYLRQTGIVLHYDDNKSNSKLQDYIFCNPNLLLTLFGLLYNHNYYSDEIGFVWKNRDFLKLPSFDFEALRRNLRQEALIGEKLLRVFWTKIGLDDDVFRAILSLLENFEICYEIDKDISKPLPDGRHFRFPFLLKHTRPGEEANHVWPEYIPDGTEEYQVVLLLDTSVLPIGFFETVSVRVNPYVDRRVDWKDGILAFCNDSQDLIKMSVEEGMEKINVRFAVRVYRPRRNAARHIMLLMVAIANKILVRQYPGILGLWLVVCTHCIRLQKKHPILQVDMFPADDVLFAESPHQEVQCANFQQNETLTVDDLLPLATEVTSRRDHMSEVYRRAIQGAAPQLELEIEAKELLPEFLKNGLLTLEQAENIIRHTEKKDRNRLLLGLLQTCGDKAFLALCRALDTTSQHHLAKELKQNTEDLRQEFDKMHGKLRSQNYNKKAARNGKVFNLDIHGDNIDIDGGKISKSASRLRKGKGTKRSVSWHVGTNTPPGNKVNIITQSHSVPADGRPKDEELPKKSKRYRPKDKTHNVGAAVAPVSHEQLQSEKLLIVEDSYLPRAISNEQTTCIGLGEKSHENNSSTSIVIKNENFTHPSRRNTWHSPITKHDSNNDLRPTKTKKEHCNYNHGNRKKHDKDCLFGEPIYTSSLARHILRPGRYPEQQTNAKCNGHGNDNRVNTHADINSKSRKQRVLNERCVPDVTNRSKSILAPEMTRNGPRMETFPRTATYKYAGPSIPENDTRPDQTNGNPTKSKYDRRRQYIRNVNDMSQDKSLHLPQIKSKTGKQKTDQVHAIHQPNIHREMRDITNIHNGGCFPSQIPRQENTRTKSNKRSNGLAKTETYPDVTHDKQPGLKMSTLDKITSKLNRIGFVIPILKNKPQKESVAQTTKFPKVSSKNYQHVPDMHLKINSLERGRLKGRMPRDTTLADTSDFSDEMSFPDGNSNRKKLSLTTKALVLKPSKRIQTEPLHKTVSSERHLKVDTKQSDVRSSDKYRVFKSTNNADKRPNAKTELLKENNAQLMNTSDMSYQRLETNILQDIMNPSVSERAELTHMTTELPNITQLPLPLNNSNKPITLTNYSDVTNRSSHNQILRSQCNTRDFGVNCTSSNQSIEQTMVDLSSRSVRDNDKACRLQNVSRVKGTSQVLTRRPSGTLERNNMIEEEGTKSVCEAVYHTTYRWINNTPVRNLPQNATNRKLRQILKHPISTNCETQEQNQLSDDCTTQYKNDHYARDAPDTTRSESDSSNINRFETLHIDTTKQQETVECGNQYMFFCLTGIPETDSVVAQ